MTPIGEVYLDDRDTAEHRTVRTMRWITFPEGEVYLD
jgi:hypothetical protein